MVGVIFLLTKLASARKQKRRLADEGRSMNELSEKDKGSVGHNDKLGIWLGMREQRIYQG